MKGEEGNVKIGRQLVQNILNLRNEKSQLIIEKFTTKSILFNLEKQQIEMVELFSKYKSEGFSLFQFVRFFLSVIPHEKIENLYLAIGLIDLFKDIAMTYHCQRICLRDITNYMCQKILKSESTFHKIEQKYVPFTNFVNPNEEIKEFLQNPPVIHGQSDQKIYKLCIKNIKTDSSKHLRAIVNSKFCSSLKRIFILDSLSDSISSYNQNCQLDKKIAPTLCKLKKQVIILAFTYSKRQFRIGAVLKDFSVKFWDSPNNFHYQKSISTTSLCQNLQTNIYFFEYFNVWATSDRTGTLSYWNLMQERPERRMKCKYKSNIIDVCQISPLNLLVVVQQSNRSGKTFLESYTQHEITTNYSESNIILYNFFTGSIVTEIQLGSQRIPHTIRYSEAYQVLFMCGLQRKIKIYELHPIYFDASLRGELIGHQNLITSFTLIQGTPMVASADDKGRVKLWDFRSFTCLQTTDFSDKTAITNLLDMAQIGKLGVMGSRVNFVQFQGKTDLIKKCLSKNKDIVQWFDVDQNLKEIYVFISRNLKIVDMATGKIKTVYIFETMEEDEDFTLFKYFACLKKFALGNAKGEISLYSIQTGEKDYTLKSNHEGAVFFLEYDELNRLFISAGVDSNIFIHREQERKVIRQLKNNFYSKQITCIDLSVYHNLIAIGSHSESIYLWNYEFGKLVAQIKLKEREPTSIKFINGYSMLVVGCANGNIYLFRIQLGETQIQELSCFNGKGVTNIITDVVIKGRFKDTFLKEGLLYCTYEDCSFGQINFTQVFKSLPLRAHCKEKSNYNPYRDVKETFSSEIQKKRHIIFQSEGILHGWNFKTTQIHTNYSFLNIFKVFRLEQRYKIGVGNDKRLKIWNQSNNQLCDMNINFSLPYKWELNPVNKGILLDKIYFGIRAIESITTKYSHDISPTEAKNMEIKELLMHVQGIVRYQEGYEKMITQPELKIETFQQLKNRENKDKKIALLQNQYSKKDLHFDLVKMFNFTEIAGPTLKQLDHLKKMENLQKQWKMKEQKEEKQKGMLLRSIQMKAQRTQERDQLQNLLSTKNKRTYQHHYQFTENDKITELSKKLNDIQSPSIDCKLLMSTFNKSLYSRFMNRLDSEKKEQNDKPSKPTKYRNVKSFENYYMSKNTNTSDISSKGKVTFRNILTQMNGRIKSIKKRIRKQPNLLEDNYMM